MHKIVPLAATGLVLALGVGLFGASQARANTVSLSIDGQIETVTAHGWTVADVLADRRIVIGVHDTVAPELSSPVDDGTQITVRYGRPVVVFANGVSTVRWTTATSVDEALAAVNLRAADSALSISRSMPLGREGLTVTLGACPVKVEANGVTKSVSVAGRVLDAINAAGIVLRVDDKLSVSLDTQLHDGLVIKITNPSDPPAEPANTLAGGSPAPKAQTNLTPAQGETCIASIYTDTQTASGEPYSSSAFVAAHKSLPFGTRVKVTNLATGATVLVRINDRGPYVAGRCLDLTPVAFAAIAPLNQGLVKVAWEIVS